MNTGNTWFDFLVDIIEGIYNLIYFWRNGYYPNVRDAVLAAQSQAGLVEIDKKKIKDTLRKTVYADGVLRQKYGDRYIHHMGVAIGKIDTPADIYEIVGTAADGRKIAVIVSQSYEEYKNLRVIGIVDIKTGKISLTSK